MNYTKYITLILKFYTHKDEEWARYHLNRCIDNTDGPVTHDLVMRILNVEFDIAEVA